MESSSGKEMRERQNNEEMCLDFRRRVVEALSFPGYGKVEFQLIRGGGKWNMKDYLNWL